MPGTYVSYRHFLTAVAKSERQKQLDRSDLDFENVISPPVLIANVGCPQ